MTIPDQIPGQYLSHLPVSPEGNRIGFWTKRQQRRERRQTRGLKSAQRRYLKEGERFLLSYKKDSAKTLGMWRDFLIAQAVFTSNINTQYQTSDQSQLTVFADKFWRIHHFDSFWNQRRDLRDYYYGGTLGSVAFSLLDADPLPPDSDVLDIIEVQQRQFWKRLDLIEVPLERKYSRMLERMGFSVSEAERLESDLVALFELSFNEDNYDLAQILRQNQITKGEVSRLARKIPRLKISQELVQSLKTIEKDISLRVGSNWLVDQLVKFVRLCPPGGVDLFLMGLAVEAYYELIQLVERFDLSQPLLEWEQSLDKDTFELYVGYFGLIRDCFSLVGSLQFLEPSRNYFESLLAFYQDLDDDDLRFWLRLKEDNPVNPKRREIRPARGEPLILLSTSRYYRGQIQIDLEWESNEPLYVCDLKGGFPPQLIESSPSKFFITPDQFGRHQIVASDQKVTSLSDLKSVKSHSAIKETNYLDQQTPYLP